MHEKKIFSHNIYLWYIIFFNIIFSYEINIYSKKIIFIDNIYGWKIGF